MAANLCRTQAMFQIPRAIPALISRTQATQATPTAGKGIPTPGNFNSATPPTSSNTTGAKSTPPFGSDPAANQSFMNTPAGKAGAIAVLTIGIYAGYKMISGSKDDSKDHKQKKDQKDQKGEKDKEQHKGSGGGDQKDKKEQKGGGDDQKDQKDQKGGKDNQQSKSGGGGSGDDQQANNAKGNDAKK